MIVATKRAAGSEYDYHIPFRAPQPKQNIRVRVRRRTSPMVGVAAGICLIALFFLIGLSYTFVKASKAQLYYKINQIKLANSAINSENEKMSLDIARLKSLDRIENIAVHQLGMVKEPKVQYLALHENNDKGIEQVSNIAAVESTEEISAGKKLLMRISSALSEKAGMEKG